MNNSKARKTFTRVLINILVAIVVVAICYLIGSETTATAVITTILLFGMVFVLMFYWIIVIQELIRHIFDKKKQKFDYFYLINVIAMTIALALYLIFYFQLLGGAFFEILL